MAVIYCNYKKKDVIVNEYNLDCVCATVCDKIHGCNSLCVDFLIRKMSADQQKKCRGCTQMTKHLQKQARQR